MRHVFMRHVFATIGSAALALMASAVAANAVEIKVGSVGATRAAVENIGKEFMKATGHTLSFTFENPVILSQRLAKGETWDALILSKPALDDVEKAGGVQPGSRLKIARVGIGVTVKDGGPVPDVSTVEAFKKTMLAARAIVHGDPTAPNSSGMFAAEALKRAGIADEVKGKVKIAGLDPAAEMIRKGEADVGFVNVSEIRSGLKLAGPLPGPLQSYTNYESSVMKAATQREAAAAFVKFLGSDAASRIWLAAAIEPVAAQ
ncbi:MAG: molybdate transport system substrate-binding protein [Alphaproteobacteria bacterium]|jgi:molybdate transport system substrate-binding protein|nr:molybdate transport system substrate-binding protein [Alphaproteobacteria bacterium]